MLTNAEKGVCHMMTIAERERKGIQLVTDKGGRKGRKPSNMANTCYEKYLT